MDKMINIREIAIKHYNKCNAGATLTVDNLTDALIETALLVIEMCSDNLFTGTNVSDIKNKYYVSKDDILELKKLISVGDLSFKNFVIRKGVVESIEKEVNELKKQNEITEKKLKPIGLIPIEIYERNLKIKRYEDVCAAISAYYQEGLKIDMEWIKEHNELLEYFEKNGIKKRE